MAPRNFTMPPAPVGGNPAPIPYTVDARCPAGLLVEPDRDNQLVIVSLAAERDARLRLAPEAALDLAAFDGRRRPSAGGSAVRKLTLAADTEIGEIWANQAYHVIKRALGTPPGARDPSCISLSPAHKRRPPTDWRHLPAIKNQLVGPEVEAIELYPAESRLVDTSNLRHLWCIEGDTFSFGFDDRDMSDDSDTR
jgi:hypothetical protein